MVGEDGLKGLEGQVPGEAAQALTAILQTHYMRYLIIASWALGLVVTVGPIVGLIWFVATVGAGALRGLVERRVSQSLNESWGNVFTPVATVSTAVWALAPLISWYSNAAFGRELAIALLISGYVLVFAQLRSSPRQAIIVSSPYGAAAVIIVISLIGGPLFWPFITLFPFTVGSLFVMVVMSFIREERIRAFQLHQAHLIEELEAARDKANAASEAKSAFLGVISHELRTPMNGVLGAAQLLSASRLEPTQREYLSIIRNSGDNLLNLLNDILDMTKIEAGKMNFEVVDVEVEELNRRVIGPFVAQAEAKGLQFVHEFQGEVPAVVRGDPLRVCQVVQNLLSNAVKFTDRGTIRYVVRGTRLSDRRVRFDFSVSDSGSGISEEDLTRLFQPFTQVDNSSTRRFGGTGLGLTIARRMAHIMGGDITVSSRLGHGSTFTLSLDGEVVEWNTAKATPDFDPAQLAGGQLNVLVVEDHPVNRMILEAWMSEVGHRTSTAEHGEEALKLVASQRFDLIIMDVNMPVMDGLTATRRIREGQTPNADTPIVVLSASARSEDHEAGLAAGADAYIDKPIDFRQLAALLAEVPAGRSALAHLSRADKNTAEAA
ncbi:response regulator [Brevundimonas vesicularis]|uniref:response regulator n=1 Tax=Brevundimonas vesicularis TaxID=41276 RepID=UPI0038D39D82